MQALLVSDDYSLAEELVSAAYKEGHVVSVQDLETTGRFFVVGEAEIVLYDLGPGRPDNWKCLARWIRDVRVPLIVIGSDTQCATDAVRALRMGADDYVLRPLYLSELLARMEALVRRVEMSETRDENVVGSSDFQINSRASSVQLGGKQISLTPTEFRVLALLVKHAGDTVPREKLMADVWGEDTPISDASLNLYVWNLRQKLEADPSRPQLIVTRWGVGYSFRGPSNDT